jgi:hypothetical protein
MGCIKLDILEKSFVPMKVVYSSSDVEQKSVQRFLRVDPLYENSMGISSYDYCHDNPLIFVDPNGKAERKVVIKGLTSTINIFSGVLEISTGVAGAPESGGLSTVLIVDGLARISMSGPEFVVTGIIITIHKSEKNERIRI